MHTARAALLPASQQTEEVFLSDLVFCWERIVCGRLGIRKRYSR